MAKSTFGDWFRDQAVKNPASTEYVPPAVQEPEPQAPVFSVDIDVIGAESHLVKNGVRIEPKDLTDQEKLEVINMLLADMASEANTQWEIAMGDDL